MKFGSLSQSLLIIFASVQLIGCGGGGGGGTGGETGAFDDGFVALNGNGNALNVGNPVDLGNPVDNGGPVTAQVDIDLRQAMVAGGVVAAQAPTHDTDKVALGRALMFDKILSGNKDISCATCHSPNLGTGDALSVSIGTGGVGAGENRILGANRDLVPRNAPPLYNLSGVDTMFWDGRVHSNGNDIESPAGAQLPQGLDSALAAQAMFPVTSRVEMRGNAGDNTIDNFPNELAAIADNDIQGIWDGLMTRLLAIPGYQALFQAAYPNVAQQDLGFEHAANAIAAFEEVQFGTFDSPFDRYVAGDDSALSDQQKRGALLFYGQARCSSCHSGSLLSDFQFHNIASPQVGPGLGTDAPLDLGRATETGLQQDRFRFRTPPLRNVALTGPWMHAGAYTSLQAVVQHYRNPANALRNYDGGQLRGDLQPLVFVNEQINAGILNNLDPVVQGPNPLNQQEVADIVAFLEALTDPTAVQRANDIPATVPSGLPVND